jgi:hypothetical protein
LGTRLCFLVVEAQEMRCVWPLFKGSVSSANLADTVLCPWRS